MHNAEIEDLKLRVAATEQKLKTVQDELKANTDITQAIKDDTNDLVEFTRTISGLTKFARWIGKAMITISPVVAIFVSIWAVLKGAKQP